jgi:small GTP-binding protein
MQDQWMRDGQGFLLVYSITSRETFENVSDLREKIHRAKDEDKVPIVLVGNKCDLTSERVVSYEEGQSLAASWGHPFFETSAKTKENHIVCFTEVVREILKAEASKSNAGRRNKKKRFKCVIL